MAEDRKDIVIDGNAVVQLVEAKSEIAELVRAMLTENLDVILLDLAKASQDTVNAEVPVSIKFVLTKEATKRRIEIPKGVKVEWYRQVKRDDVSEPLIVDLDQMKLPLESDEN